jgi:hypothetical protein
MSNFRLLTTTDIFLNWMQKINILVNMVSKGKFEFWYEIIELNCEV